MPCCPWISWLKVFAVFAVLAAVVVGVAFWQGDPGAAAVDDKSSWPMFGGTPQRNLVNTVDKNIATEWTVKEGEQKNIKWAVELGTLSYGGPAIGAGKVFVGTNNQHPRNPAIKGDKGVVMCFNLADGKFLWQAVHDKLPNPEANDWPQQGVASTPAIDGNRLYYVSNRCELICADTEGFLDGKNDGVQDEQLKGKTDADIIWRLDMIKELDVYPHFLANSSPLVAGDLVFVITGNGVDEEFNVAKPKAPSFVAVNKNTGKVAWQSDLPGKNIMGGQWTNPAYAMVNGKAQAIFPGGDGWVYGLEAETGKLIWKFDGNPKKAKFTPGGRGEKSYFLGTPVVVGNRCYIGMGQNPDDGPGVGHLWCIDITKTGDVSPVGDNFDPKAEVNKNSALVWHFGGYLNPKPEIGREVYFGRTLSTCAVHDGLLWIAELDGYAYCLDAETGKKYWEHDLKAETWGSPFWVDGKIYLGTGDGEVLVFQHGKEKKLLVANDMEANVKSTPVATGGVLYILTDSQLYAIQPK
ncbi:MAG: PQQ-binding-like beta-propeller repeat protein [Gemmataceae bacterium]